MKIYRGRRTETGCVVTVDGHDLPPRLDLFNHSPTGFEWGYHGSGPAQLALALLADATGDDKLALRLYQDFKRDTIANYSQSEFDDWQLTQDWIRAWVLAHR